VLILALDTTTRGGSVAVTRDDEVLALVDGDQSRTHGERLPGEIDTALRRAGLSPQMLDLLVVASGPGAFTGLRIGLAAIQGIAMVTGTAVVGVSALDALAHAARIEAADFNADLIVSWMDAARGDVFSAVYEATATAEATDLPRAIDNPVVHSPAQLLAMFASDVPRRRLYVGDGALRYREDIHASAHGLARVIELVPSLAPSLAWIGRRMAAAGAAGPPHALQPLYVRRPDAELERDRRSIP
jgi:tRNA threonylcarbamoyladenosine biosynthesis protein TsaB